MKRFLTVVIVIGCAAVIWATPALIKDEKPVVSQHGKITISVLTEPSQERLDQMAVAEAARVRYYIVYEVSPTNPKVRFASQPVALTAEEIPVLEGAGDIVEEIK